MAACSMLLIYVPFELCVNSSSEPHILLYIQSATHALAQSPCCLLTHLLARILPLSSAKVFTAFKLP